MPDNAPYGAGLHLSIRDLLAVRGIAVGQLFPQEQAAFGGYTRNQLSRNAANQSAGLDRSYDDYQVGGAAAWELDLWGKYRRGIEAADADVLAAVATYDDVLVTLIGEVASKVIRQFVDCGVTLTGLFPQCLEQNVVEITA